MKKRTLSAVTLVMAMTGCATVSDQPAKVEAPQPRVQQAAAQQAQAAPALKTFKRKIAIGRFSNETRYGRTFVTDSSLDPLGKQASDILAARLVESKQFMVFERPDLTKIAAEQGLNKDGKMIGVDTLILGSVTEFGRGTTGKAGFLSSTKVQTAHAKVELRLVDVKTGYVFFSAQGSGEASTESGEIAGFGSRADYDGTLNDKAISAAISDVIGAMMTKLNERQWRTDILKVDGSTVFITGGRVRASSRAPRCACTNRANRCKAARPASRSPCRPRRWRPCACSARSATTKPMKGRLRKSRAARLPRRARPPTTSRSKPCSQAK
ncbi:Curli biogenesis system outer membrane secretion channel CsgG [Burkholderia sp. OK233]|nr:Curli biogenesis system outer membrane secretion channel CsgG [Burkholderia sp. OK233]